MNFNLTKHDVNTEETILCESVEVPVEGNVVIYDKGKNVKKLIKSCFKANLTSKSISDRSVRLDGTVNVCLIYLDENNSICSFDHILPFSKTVDTVNDLSSAKVSAEISDERFTANTSGDNKVSITGTVSIKLCVKNSVASSVICDIDGGNVEQLKCDAEITMPMGVAEKSLILEEEISIGNGQPSVGNVIRYSATAVVDESKIINNKVMVKGTVNVYVLYSPEEGTRPQCFSEGFPFSLLVDVDGINDSCKCQSDAQIVFCELNPKVSSDDEIRGFSVSLKVIVSVKAYCDDCIPVLIDAYSTAGNLKAVTNELSFKKIKININDRFVAKKTLEFTDGAIGSVIDLWCENKSSSAKIEDGTVKITGILEANLLAYDTEGVPCCYERPIDYEYTYAPEGEYASPEIEYCLNIQHCSYTVIGANTVDVAAEIMITGSIYDNKKYCMLTDVLECETDKKPTSGSIVLYFADKGERLWDVARRYNSSMKEIKELNHITDDCLLEPAKIIIPTK